MIDRDEIVATLHDGLADAWRRRGLLGVAAYVLGEAWDVVKIASRALTGRPRGRVSGGPPSAPREPMRRLLHDTRFAIRNLAASRLNTSLAVLTLALGIGVSSAVFSILDAVLWRPVPFRDAARLVEISNLDPERKVSYRGLARPVVLEWRKQTDLFDRLEAYESASLVYRGAGGAEMISGAAITPGLMDLLGAAPALGRAFTGADGRAGTGRLALVSERFWRSEFGGDAAIVGRQITLDDVAHTIVGVMPASFRFPTERQVVWLPYNLDAPPPEGDQRAGSSTVSVLAPIAKLPPDLAFEVADERTQARGTALSEAAGATATLSARLWRLDRGVDAGTERSLLVLGLAVVFLLLIVCANLANLALSRSLSRSRDLAVRAALGASRGALVRETLLENVLLGAAGAAAGLLVGAGILSAASAILPDAVTARSLNAIDLDARAVAFTGVVAVLTILIFGLAPALIASRVSLMNVLRHDGRTMAGGRASRRLRSALVVAEVAVSTVLVVGATLMTRSVMKLYAIDRGLDARGLVALRVGLPSAGYGDPRQRDRFTEEVVHQLRTVPGVVGATTGAVPPEMTKVNFGKVEIQGQPSTAERPSVVPLYEVPPDFFATLGIPIVDGRTFGDADPEGAVLVNERFARTHWPGAVAVGRRFRIGDQPWRTVIGVAGNVRRVRPESAESEPQLYYRLGDESGAAVPVRSRTTIAEDRTIIVRVDDPGAVAGRLRQAVHAVDPTVVIRKVELVEHFFAEALARPRIVLLVMSLFAACGLTLAAAGLYGVLSWLVGQRTREIGIRLALGARPREIGRAVFANGLGLAAAGLVVGLAGAAALVRLMQALLYDVEPSDPMAIGVACVTLIATASLAAWRPARRAMQVDPVALLRQE